VLSTVPPIIPDATFQAVQAKRASRRPTAIAPRVVNSPTLLTGLLRCGACGAGMTVATGKGGRYRYYKCGNQIRRGTACPTRAIRVEQLDAAVCQRLCERVFTVDRVRRMVEDVHDSARRTHGASTERLRRLHAALEQNRLGSARLYAAVEQGLLPTDATLTARAHELKTERQTLLAEIAGLEREQAFAASPIPRTHVEAFCRTIQTALRAGQTAKRHLRLLLDEIRVTRKTALMRGSYAALAHALRTLTDNPTGAVPTFGPEWLPGTVSNPSSPTSVFSCRYSVTYPVGEGSGPA
jgi:hypothetical protein